MSLNGTNPLASESTQALKPAVGIGQTVYIRRTAGDDHPWPAIVWGIEPDGTTINATMFGPFDGGTERAMSVPRKPTGDEWPTRTWGYTP